MPIFHLGRLHSFSKKVYALILFIFLHYSSSSIWIFCILSFFFLFSLLDHCLDLPTYHFSLFLNFLPIFYFLPFFVHPLFHICLCLPIYHTSFYFIFLLSLHFSTLKDIFMVCNALPLYITISFILFISLSLSLPPSLSHIIFYS